MSRCRRDAFVFLRQSIQRGGLTGGSRFVEEVAARVGKRIELRSPGRPKK